MTKAFKAFLQRGMDGMVYDYGFTLAAFFVALFCRIYTFRSPLGMQHGYFRNIFRVLVSSVMLTPLFSFISTYIDKAGLGGQYYYVMVTTQVLLFMVHHVTAPAFAVYCMALNGTLRGRKKGFYCGLFTPVILAEILIISNIFTGQLFYYKNNHYARGSYLAVLYLIAVFYYVLGIVQMFRGRRTMNRRNWMYLFMCYSVVSIGVLVQLFFPSIQAEYFGEAFGVSILMIVFENDTMYLDPETRLFSRQGFMEDIRVAGIAERPYTLIVVRIGELRQLKNIMDGNTFNSLLYHISDLILQGHMKGETVYNYEMGSIVIMMNSLKDDVIESRKRRLRENLETRGQIGDTAFALSANIISVKVPEEISSINTILALCEDPRAFESGKVVICSNEEVQRTERYIKVEKALRKAITDKTIEIYIQPIWWAEENRIRSGEVLARMKDPELGNIPPFEFIPIAEKNGLMGELGDLIIEKTCRYLSDCDIESLGLYCLEVNVSPYQLPGTNVSERFMAILEKWKIPVEQINIEITETYDIESSKMIMNNVQELQNAGFAFSIDDFGTGYSNFSVLSSGIYTNLKIDRSILLSADKEEGRKLLKTIYEMSRAMKLKTIQEGVETEEQLALVKEYGVDMIQGYYFSKPVPLDEFTDYARAYNQAG